MTIGFWNLPTPAESKPQPVVENHSSILIQTAEDWYQRGYSLWRCRELRGDVIMVVDQARPTAAPDGYPVYTVDELAMIDALAPSTMRLVHAAKKAGAVVIKVEKRKGNAKI